MPSDDRTDTQTDRRSAPMGQPWSTRLSRLPGRLLRSRVVQVYLALLVLSHLFIGIANPTYSFLKVQTPAGATRLAVSIPEMDRGGPVGEELPVELSVLRWDGAQGVRTDAPDPVVLLHPSPSFRGAAGYDDLASRLAASGRTVYAIDRPGYGASQKRVPDHSARAQARMVVAAIDELGIDRAHFVGWGYSGLIVLWVGEFEHERVASQTLISSLGDQQVKGSGDYAFEHFKHTLGYGLGVLAPDFIPHFGLLGPRSFRRAAVRDFYDTDQRPLTGVMSRSTIPTLILHGRDDLVVASRSSELHHEMIESSRLVMLEGGHRAAVRPQAKAPIVFETAVVSMTAFFDHHDQPGTPVRVGVADFDPDSGPRPIRLAGREIDPLSTAWYLLVLLIVLGTLVSEDLTVIAVGLLLSTGMIDYGVALMGCFIGIMIGDYGLWAIGRFGGTRLLRMPLFRRIITEEQLEHWGRVLGRHTGKAVLVSRMLPGTRLPMYIAAGIVPGHNKRFLFWVTVAVAIWTPFLLTLTALLGPKLLGFFETIFHGPWAILAAFIVLVTLLRVASLEATETGRARLRAGIRRVVTPEFWPLCLFYVPLIPWLLMLAVRHRSLTVFTCANAGIPNGGGVVGESKARIMEGFAAGGVPVLPSHRIPRIVDPALNDAEIASRRLDQLFAVLEDPASGLGTFPVVLKPEAGQRGHGVRIIETRDQASDYFKQAKGDVIVQRYAPGPNEYGLLWARDMDRDGSMPMDDRPGFIFSVTRKEFPVVEGDGATALEMLIWRDKRYRMQGRIFQKRHEARRDLVLPAGDRYQLARAGNHAQGTQFLDGSDLITPQLSEWAEHVMQRYRDPDGRVDFGRLDVRCPSEEDFRAGRNIEIIECNGTFSESTNLYDPSKSVVFMYKVLFRQWALLYRIGAARRREGARPLGLIGLLRLHRAYRRGRSGPAIAD